MSNPLPKLYRDRATSTPAAPDLDEVMSDVRARVEHRARRRRTGLAAGGSVVAVAALAIGTVLVTTSGSDDRGGQAAGPAPHSSSRPSRVHTVHAGPPTSSSSTPRPRRVTVRTDGGLVTGTTPKSAPLALGTVPDRFRYLGAAPSATTYGPPQVKNPDPSVFARKLTLIVGTRYSHKAFADRIAGLPAQIRALEPTTDDDTRWIVDLDYNNKIQLTIQVPNSAGLTRAQVRTMAQTLEIRDVSHPAKG